MAGPRSLYRIEFQSELLSLLSIKDLTPLLCRISQMSNPQSVPPTKEEVTEEKASNLSAKDNTANICVVSFRDVARTISRLSFVPLVIREFSMTKRANRSVVNHRSSLLLLEDRAATITEDLVVVAEENEDEERVVVMEEELTLSLMSPSNIMTNLTMRNFRIIRP